MQIAQLADGFISARQGGTVVMVSAVSDRKEMDESGFLPLAVEYREKVRASRGLVGSTADLLPCWVFFASSDRISTLSRCFSFVLV